MSQQLQTPGGDDFITIRGQMQNSTTLKIISFQIVIKDQYAVASFDDPYFARKMVKQENRHGNRNIRYSEKINSAIEHYPNKTKNEIAKIIGKKLKDGGAKLQK